MMCTDDEARTIRKVINMLVINGKKVAASQENLSVQADQLDWLRVMQ